MESVSPKISLPWSRPVLVMQRLGPPPPPPKKKQQKKKVNYLVTGSVDVEKF